MIAPLAPIQARAAEDAMRGRGFDIDTDASEKSPAGTRHLAPLVGQRDMFRIDKPLRDADAEPAGEMIVAGARVAHRRVAGPSHHGVRGRDHHHAFEHLRDERRR